MVINTETKCHPGGITAPLDNEEREIKREIKERVKDKERERDKKRETKRETEERSRGWLSHLSCRSGPRPQEAGGGIRLQGDHRWQSSGAVLASDSQLETQNRGNRTQEAVEHRRQ